MNEMYALINCDKNLTLKNLTRASTIPRTAPITQETIAISTVTGMYWIISGTDEIIKFSSNMKIPQFFDNRF